MMLHGTQSERDTHNYMEPCKHENTECPPEGCECFCDSCQTDFERGWIERATNENLCVECGVPKQITVTKLLETQYTHFFQPCKDCLPGVKACLTAANLCETCREPLNGPCVKCTCTGKEECSCRECVAFRNQGEESL